MRFWAAQDELAAAFAEADRLPARVVALAEADPDRELPLDHRAARRPDFSRSASDLTGARLASVRRVAICASCPFGPSISNETMR